MIGFDEAIDRLRSAVTPLGIETIPLSEASRRVLAKPVVAAIASPRADVSAMDGYAVRAADLSPGSARLKVIGESAAGTAWVGSLDPRTCVRIFTGAAVPTGADLVVIQEVVRRDGDYAHIEKVPADPPFIRKRGSDFAAGDALLASGRSLDPRAIIAAAAADLSKVQVYRAPRFRIIATGDELAEPGSAHRRADAVPDSVSPGIAALATQWGGNCLGAERLGDDLAILHDAAAKAIGDADLVVVTGGASVGERDFGKAMFEPLNIGLIFSKVAIKPGKPVWFGRVGECLVLGLPGNPTSAMVTARLFLAPLLALLQGSSTHFALNWRTASLGSPLPACGIRETFHRALLAGGTAEVLSFQESHAQKALADADLLVRQSANSAALPIGTPVQVLDF